MSLFTAARDAAARPRPVAVVIGVLILADMVSAFESTMMISALPRLIAEFGVSAADGSWVLTAFALVAAASAAVCGRLGDIYGRRRLLIALLLISGIGSLVSIVTGTLAGLIVGRAVQGVSGGILPLCYGLIRENLPKERVPVGVALLASTMMLAGAAGAIVAGVLIDTLSWHYIFVLAAGVALAGALAALVLPPSTVTDQVPRVDWVGAVLFAPAVALVLFGITSAARSGLGDGGALGTLLGGVVLLALWVWWELRIDHPLINIRMLMERNQFLVLLITAVVAAGVFGTTSVVVQLIMQSPVDMPVGLGMSATAAGVVTFVISCVAFLFAPVASRIAVRYGPRRSLVVGCTIGVGSGLAFALLSGTVPGMICALTLLNVGLTFTLTALPTLIVQSVPPENTSEATGVNQVARTAFTGVGSVVGGVVLSSSLVPGTPYGTASAYLGVFSIVVLSSVVALALAFALRAPRL